MFFRMFAGYLLFKDFCKTLPEGKLPELEFYDEVRENFAVFLSDPRSRSGTTVRFVDQISSFEIGRE